MRHPQQTSAKTSCPIVFLALILILGINALPAIGASGKLTEPCNLLPKSEVENIMATTMQEGKYSENKVVGQKQCLYEAADPNSFTFLQISLTQNGFIDTKVLAAGQTALTIFTSIKEAFPDRENVPGIGDEAFLATPGLHILRGDYYLLIGAGNLEKNKDKLINAGKTAIATLEASR